MGNYGDHNSSGIDPTSEGGKEVIKEYIERRSDGVIPDYKNMSREISDKFGVILTPKEVKDFR